MVNKFKDLKKEWYKKTEIRPSMKIHNNLPISLLLIYLHHAGCYKLFKKEDELKFHMCF